MLVLAHRGLHDGHVAENTIAAFESALAVRADGIETDVRLTKDGVPVLFHDPAVRRRKVASLTHAELSRISRRDVPSLEEALERFDVFWNVEIKSADAVGPAVAVLRRFRSRRRLLVTSFQPGIVARVGKALRVDCGRIFSRAPLRGRRRPGTTIVLHFRIASGLRVRRLHAEGRRVFVYGPRTRAEHERCVSLGVEGVITDWPERLRGIRA